MEYEVKRDGGTLYCRRQGEGPLLLMIHGVACDSDFFRETAKILAENYTVITYDRRGYSRSRAAEDETDYTVETQAEDAAAVILDYGDDPALVVGCSAGGAVAAVLAVRHPELTAGVFLHEPLLMAEGEVRADQDAFWEKLCASARRHRIITCMMHFIHAMGGAKRNGKSQPMEQQQRNLNNLEHFLYREMDSFSGLEAKDVRLQVPVCVAVGTDDESGMFCRSARWAAERNGWPLLPVPGYHNLAQDEPELFAALVMQWAKETFS